MTAKSVSRRKFLTLAGLTGTGLGLAACAQKPAATPTAMAGMEGGSPTPSGAGYEEMDKMHKPQRRRAGHQRPDGRVHHRAEGQE